MLRLVLILAAVLFICFAAFQVTLGTDIIWLYLGLACWAASFAASGTAHKD